MSIVLRQPGEAKAVAAAGNIIGKARSAEQEREQANRLAAEQRAMPWELEKMEMRSRQDFEKELRDRQFAYDAEERSKQWQLEKMEMASRLDFQQEEQKRIERTATFNAGIEAIDGKEGMSDEQRNRAKFEYASKYYDVKDAAPYLGVEPQKDSTMLSQLIKQQQQQNQVGITDAKKIKPETFEQAKKEGKTIVRNKATGQIETLPNDEVTLQVARGNAEIIEEATEPNQTLNRLPMIYEMEDAASKGMSYLVNKSTGAIELKPIEEVRGLVKSGKYEIANAIPLAKVKAEFHNRGSFYF